ncbi:MAG TPA: hypothetical protein VNG89_14245, partial [Vicinamibacterales bacterium]|nr:hypothetical protein [Vicinamibacterales bacterium]
APSGADARARVMVIIARQEGRKAEGQEFKAGRREGGNFSLFLPSFPSNLPAFPSNLPALNSCLSALLPSCPAGDSVGFLPPIAISQMTALQAG